MVPRGRQLLYVFPISFLIAYIWVLPGIIRGCEHSRSDFIEWWSASSLVLGGSPAAVYDNVRLWATEKSIAGAGVGFTPFPYPPIYLLMIAPLAYLPYLGAMLLWSVIGLIAYALILGRIEPRGLLLALVFPGAFLSLISGQNGFLTITLLGTAVFCLDRRPILAGLILGLCAYKPQLASLVPLFLCVTARWRTLVASAASLALFGLLSCAAFGWHIWPAFFHSIQFTRVVVLEHGAPRWQKFETVFSAARMWGFGIEASYLFHFSVAIPAVAAAVVVWRRASVVELQAAALVLATMLVTPHLLEYDTVLLALPIAWLAVDGLRSRFLPGDIVILAMLWLYPAVMRELAPHGLPLTPVVIAAALFICVRRSLYSASSPYRANTPLDTGYRIANMAS
jgi:alpha-1,2-mannosyltransferase